jgi:hypothetical protein
MINMSRIPERGDAANAAVIFSDKIGKAWSHDPRGNSLWRYGTQI